MCVVPQAKKQDSTSSSPTPAMSSVLGVSDITKGAGTQVRSSGLSDAAIAAFRNDASKGGPIGSVASKMLTQQGVSIATPPSGTDSSLGLLPDPAAVFAPRIQGALIGPAQLKIPSGGTAS